MTVGGGKSLTTATLQRNQEITFPFKTVKMFTVWSIVRHCLSSSGKYLHFPPPKHLKRKLNRRRHERGNGNDVFFAYLPLTLRLHKSIKNNHVNLTYFG